MSMEMPQQAKGPEAPQQPPKAPRANKFDKDIRDAMERLGVTEEEAPGAKPLNPDDFKN